MFNLGHLNKYRLTATPVKYKIKIVTSLFQEKEIKPVQLSPEPK
jgi:hypothetical protein